ncbi:hypothetical protein Pint_17332 [Pistacia integerrima]|uniref:Uncharacterized protein n=1 Tax=Pistacia integerrima TaxID=434235 RepID=A0ACC0YXA8_9ROSI|nr:hypothetical protein Pint_17332 [Pistacia integerrima]
MEICSIYTNRDYPWEIYPLKELLHATNNFHNDNKIGEGGFGSVYWGRTRKGNEACNQIAVKRLKAMSAKAEMEFAIEVEILGRGAFDHIADPRLKGKFDRNQLKSTVMIAMTCTDSNPDNRPTMLEVVSWLKYGVRRTKEMTYVEDVNEEDEESDDNDTDFEGYRKEQANNLRRLAGF